MTNKIDFLDAGAEIDLGPHGYTSAMVVYRNEVADEKALTDAGVTHAYAELALSAPHFFVGFSSDSGGTGAWQVLLLDADQAARYPVGAETEFHFRKTREIGFGTLVAITSDPVPSLVP
ncbi:hypothetical protein [Bosea sp. ANAM02]|uniref:hypothetical protein n=1 Tax=Bosea sp. ANAM02 TaxID=2020412 RepID=UPI00140EBBF6|nr:hypothetical protein [Bosea sp. ANAM02]BCB22023.1 hypothetical protein OCUBac02_49170 [Bosea sp. ANAM02]